MHSHIWGESSGGGLPMVSICDIWTASSLTVSTASRKGTLQQEILKHGGYFAELENFACYNTIHGAVAKLFRARSWKLTLPGLKSASSQRRALLQ